MRQARILQEQFRRGNAVLIQIVALQSTLGKWVRAISDEAVAAGPDPDLLRENERLRRENRVLREEREVLEKAAMFFAAQKS